VIAEGWTEKSHAASAPDQTPEPTLETISLRCSTVNLGLRPPIRPCFRAVINRGVMEKYQRIQPVDPVVNNLEFKNGKQVTDQSDRNAT
tara:strand:+ start:253 stop:519 length:267 start_codon:yes stop_codon:yes gene_type:complete